MRYVWSSRSRCFHDTQNLSERCNTDQLKDRQQANVMPFGMGKSPCQWCFDPYNIRGIDDLVAAIEDVVEVT